VSYLADLLQHAVRAREARAKLDEYYHSHYFQQASRFLERPGDQQVDWTVARAALAHAAELARERGFALALVLFPELRQLDESYPFRDIHRLVMSTCAELGIPALDLLAALSFRPASELWVHPSDHHPNEIAHALAAEAIAAFLRAKGLVPR
jgi:hypothetical protein